MQNKPNNSQFGAANRFRSGGQIRQEEGPLLPKNIDLFPIAVVIMGVVSCYTTATGLMPMLDNWILSYATAIALSVFMVAIALRIPKAYEDGSQMKLIMGYIFVASFSVLLNFNAIYGVFTAEKLLYEELKENKSQLTAIRVSSQAALDSHFDTREIEQKLTEAKALLKEETTNRVDPGYGTKARKLNKEVVIPLTAQMEAINSRYDPAVKMVDSLSFSAQTEIDAALASGKIKTYRTAVDRSIDAHSQIGETTTRMVGEENFSYEPMVFQHRDVGNLNHSLWTLTNITQLSGKQASSVIVSLLLSLLIDFIVLFVIVMINRPAKQEKDETSSEDTNAKRNSFSSTPTTDSPSLSSTGIYAHRRDRRASSKPQLPYKQELRREETQVSPPIKEENPSPSREESSRQIREEIPTAPKEEITAPKKEEFVAPVRKEPSFEQPSHPPTWIPVDEETEESPKAQSLLEQLQQENKPKNGVNHNGVNHNGTPLLK